GGGIHIGGHPAEQVHLVGHARLGAPQRRRVGRGVRRQALRSRRGALARGAEARVQGGELVRARGAQQRPGLLQAGGGGLQVLVGLLSLGFQRVKGGVAEQLPPFAAQGLLGGLGGLPAAGFVRGQGGLRLGFFVGGRDGDVGPLVFGSHRAAGQHQQHGQQGGDTSR